MNYFLAALALSIAAAPAGAAEMIANGGFEQTTLASSSQFGARYPVGAVSGWNADGFTFLYFPGTADQPVAPGEYGCCQQSYGPGNGYANGLTAVSPAGGNFLMLDGDTDPNLRGRVSQQVSGLTPGRAYRLSFWMAGSQQLGYPGPTFDKYFDVTFGTETQRSDVLAGDEATFQPWRLNKMVFTASQATQTLTFLSHGMPWGMPPLLHLDGVSLGSAVPEPATWGMLIIGFGVVGAAVRRRAALAA